MADPPSAVTAPPTIADEEVRELGVAVVRIAGPCVVNEKVSL